MGQVNNIYIKRMRGEKINTTKPNSLCVIRLKLWTLEACKGHSLSKSLCQRGALLIKFEYEKNPQLTIAGTLSFFGSGSSKNDMTFAY